MKKKLFVLILLITTLVVNAQIDTTKWYPLHIGDMWQFSSSSGILETSFFTIEVVGDTSINGKDYSVIKKGEMLIYQRVENNSLVFEYNPFSNQEYIRYDFISPDRSLWQLDSLSGQYGIYSTQQNYIGIYGESLESKVYDSVFIDTTASVPDTSWDSLVDGLAVTISKGIGITMYGMGINVVGFVGAVIDGNTIGTITDVEETQNIITTPKLFQNYPNPFNPSTIISYLIPKAGCVTLKVYDMLGKQVATLVNQKQSSGRYEATFSTIGGISSAGSRLSTGVYVYELMVHSGLYDNYAVSKKMILLK